MLQKARIRTSLRPRATRILIETPEKTFAPSMYEAHRHAPLTGTKDLICSPATWWTGLAQIKLLRETFIRHDGAGAKLPKGVADIGHRDEGIV